MEKSNFDSDKLISILHILSVEGKSRREIEIEISECENLINRIYPITPTSVNVCFLTPEYNKYSAKSMSLENMCSSLKFSKGVYFGKGLNYKDCDFTYDVFNYIKKNKGVIINELPLDIPDYSLEESQEKDKQNHNEDVLIPESSAVEVPTEEKKD